ncbi:MAG: GWxTD domain-containing protein [Bacteroidia bacterium]
MKKNLAYLLLAFVIIACGTSRKAENKAPASSYKHDPNTIHPEFTVYHVSDSISELYFKINSKELLYTRANGVNFSTNVLISYRLLASYDAKEVVDSSSVRLLDVNDESVTKDLIGKIKVKALTPHSYFLRVTVADINRNISVTNVLTIEKENDLNRQNFLVKSKALDVPVFHSYIKLDDPLTITYKAKIAVTVFVRYYNREFPLAAPPFSISDPRPFQYKPDSTYMLQLSKDGITDFVAHKKGFYHIQLDTTKRDGLTLFNFSENFPDIKKADEMVPPLRFITSRQEYDEISTSANPRGSIEKFWLACTGSQDRAKEIIRKYYNRVKDANLFFTSYIEGWKTDRGMIYLIYGAPNVIYRTANAEVWTYGEENNINSLSYSFLKVNNPFSDNDYTLERSSVYKQSWGSAVDIWRQGRTYLQD